MRRRAKSKNNHTLHKLLLLTALVLLAMPALDAFFAESAPAAKKLDFIFHVQRTYLAIALSLVCFLFIMGKTRLEDKSHVSWGFIALGFGLLAFLSVMQIPFFTAVENGLVGVEKSGMQYDRLGILGNSIAVSETALDAGVVAKREITIANLPPAEKARIGWYGYWSGNPGGTKVLLIVNSNPIDITSTVLSAKKGEVSLFEAEVDKSLLRQGRNSISLRSEGTGSVAVIKNQYYYYDSLVSRDSAVSFVPDDGIILLFIDDGSRPGFLARQLFLYRPLFIILAFMLLFIGLFGLGYSRRLLSSKLEILASAVLGISFFAFLKLLESSWKILATGAIFVTGWLLKPFPGGVTLIVENMKCPVVGTQGSTFMVCRSSSGFESLALFTLLSIVILATNWADLQKRKFFLLYLIGALGTIIVNGIRIFLIMAVALLFSEEFAVGAFHTNIGLVLFLLYSAAFWLLALRFVKVNS